MSEIPSQNPSPSPLSKEGLIEILVSNWSLEMDGAAMYGELAKSQSIPERKTIFTKLSDLERKHADLWAKRIVEIGGEVPKVHTGKGHSLKDVGHHGGMQEVIQEIEAEERRDVAGYLDQLRKIQDEPTRAILREVVLDEFAHSHVLTRLDSHRGDRSALDYLLHRQRQGTGSWIGDAIYGVNDGLGAIFGIVSGVSGATLGKSEFVLLAGIAGMVASALSMGSGAYLAAKSEKEIFEAELVREQKLVDENPAAAKQELAIFYQLKGVPEEDASKIVEFLFANRDQFLKTMAAEKLSLTEDALSNPITSAVSGAVSTAIGAFIPIIPFFFMSGAPAVIAAAIVSLIAHFAVGAAKSLITVRSWWSSGLEMTWVGALEGIVTYIVGIGLSHVGI